MKKILVFDTETTGIPLNYKAPATDIHNWPRVIELAWLLMYEDGTEIASRSDLVKPDGWKIPTHDTFWAENGFTQEKQETEGLNIEELLYVFKVALEEADVLVAHNMSYDLPTISCEFYRAAIKVTKKTEKFCTKLASEPICKLPGWKGKYKWPSLQEAHVFFFKEEFDGAHGALADVRACSRVYRAIQEFNNTDNLI